MCSQGAEIGFALFFPRIRDDIFLPPSMHEDFHWQAKLVGFPTYSNLNSFRKRREMSVRPPIVDPQVAKQGGKKSVRDHKLTQRLFFISF